IHGGVYPRLVEEDEAAGVDARRTAAEGPPPMLDIGAVLLGGVHDFFFNRQSQPVQGAGDGAEVDGSAQAVAQLGQGSVGLLGDEYQQAVTVLRGQLERRTTTMRLGVEGAGLATALQQSADPSRGDAEKVGDLLAGAAALVAGTDHALT